MQWPVSKWGNGLKNTHHWVSLHWQQNKTPLKKMRFLQQTHPVDCLNTCHANELYFTSDLVPHNTLVMQELTISSPTSNLI